MLDCLTPTCARQARSGLTPHTAHKYQYATKRPSCGVRRDCELCCGGRRPGAALLVLSSRHSNPAHHRTRSLRVFALFLPVGCVARELSRGGDPSALDRISRESLWAEQSITPTPVRMLNDALVLPVGCVARELSRGCSISPSRMRRSRAE